MNTPSLRSLLRSGSTTVAPGVFDGLSAHLVQQAGFPAAYLTGAGVAVSAIGVPDIGLTTATEVRTQVARLSAQLDIPLIVDADTGFGNELDVYRSIGDLERAGASAIQIEDQGGSRRCGHLPGKTVVPIADAERRLRAAIAGRRDPETMIIARTDARAVEGFEAALERAQRYQAAGADVIFFEAPESEDEIATIAASVPGPLLFNVVANGKTPPISLERLTELAFALVIIPGLALKAAAVAMRDALETVTSPEGWSAAQASMSSRELFEIVGLDQWAAIEAHILDQDQADTTRPVGEGTGVVAAQGCRQRTSLPRKE